MPINMQDASAIPSTDTTASERSLPQWLTDQQAGILTATQPPPEPAGSPIAKTLMFTGAALILAVVITSIVLFRRQRKNA